MRKLLLLDCSIGIGLLVTVGCYPGTWTVTPQLSGRVETADHRPVSNASVTVDEISDNRGNRGGSFHMLTDAHGAFFREESTMWSIVPWLPIDVLVPAYTATARADGRQSKPVRLGGDGITGPHFFGLGNAYRTYDLGTLVLENPPLTTTKESK